MDELQRVQNEFFTIPRLELVKKLFLFQYYTGLSFIDMLLLKRKNIIKGSADIYWLGISRHKNDSTCQVPLFPVAIDILTKYNLNTKQNSEDLLFPNCHIQKANSYLKEIADICGINKSLSTDAGSDQAG